MVIWLCMHFTFTVGPAPYQVYGSVAPGPSSTMTENEESEILWDINSFVKELVVDRFASTFK